MAEAAERGAEVAREKAERPVPFGELDGKVFSRAVDAVAFLMDHRVVVNKKRPGVWLTRENVHAIQEVDGGFKISPIMIDILRREHTDLPKGPVIRDELPLGEWTVAILKALGY